MDNKQSQHKSQPEQAAPKADALLECLVMMTKIYHQPFSKHALTAGLPLVDNYLTLELFTRAAERAQLAAKISQTPLEKIDPLSLPVIILLNDDSACILERIDNDGSVSVIQPEKSTNLVNLPMSEFEKQFTGTVIHVRQAYQFGKRTEELLEEKGKNWFWGVIRKFAPLYSEVLVASF